MDAEISSSSPGGWTYTEIFVYDGDRVLKPINLCGDEITFREAPGIIYPEIRICVKNGDRRTIRSAKVLTHDPSSTRIPIQLVTGAEKVPSKRTA